MILIRLNFIENIFKLNPRRLKHGFRVACVLVTALTNHPYNAAVNDKHGAGSARGHAAV